MRIFCAVEQEPFPGNRLWQNNIIDALRDLGHEVLHVDYAEFDLFYKHADTTNPTHAAWIEAHRPDFETALLDQINKAHKAHPIDLFLSYFYSAHATPATIKAIRALGIKTVNWYCNASYQFNLVNTIAPAYDLSLVPEKDRLDEYRQIGAHAIYCQEAANPLFYKDLQLTRDLDVVFVGQRYATREDLCYALYTGKNRIDVWGAGWGGGPAPEPPLKQMARNARRWIQHATGAPVLPLSHCHGFVSDEQMVEIYNRAKIALGFGVVSDKHFRTRPKYQIRLRDFEAPMCGTFYLMEHQEEIREFFKVGEEIETFQSPQDLLDKVRFYLTHDTARERIRRAGSDRAHRDHTWQKRLTDSFAHLS